MSAERDRLRHAFIASQGWQGAEILPLAPDASFRGYSRLRRLHDHGAHAAAASTAMLMDAPPPEDPAAFVAITRHLQAVGARVPTLLGVDLARGFLLLEDLGEQTFTRLLARGHAETALYRQAVTALSRLHQCRAATRIALPAYSAELALREANLLLDWYIPARLQQTVNASARAAFQQVWMDILTALPPLEPALTLRDYHIDNLMLCDGECALLDYQDAVIGSPAYDLASLLEDARRDIPAPLATRMQALYLRQNPAMDARRWRQHYIVWATQRHCKVAGIFVRLWLRDGKSAYLRHLPRVLKLLQRHLEQPALAPLRAWLETHLGNPAGRLEHADFTAPAARLLRYCAGKT